MSNAGAMLGLILAILFVLAAIVYMRVAKAAMDGAKSGAKQWFVRQRIAPALVVIGTAAVAILLNVGFVESLVVALARTATKPIEGLASTPTNWIGVAASGLFALVIDIKIIRFFRRMKGNEKVPNHVPQPTPADGRG